MRKFFNEMKRVDERIVDTLHILGACISPN